MRWPLMELTPTSEGEVETRNRQRVSMVESYAWRQDKPRRVNLAENFAACIILKWYIRKES